jgi:hypothetical protein
MRTVKQYYRALNRGGAPAAPAFVSTWNTANTSSGSSASNQVNLPLINVGGAYNFVVNWGDGNEDTITVWTQAETTHTYAGAGIYTITISGDIQGWQFGGTKDRLKILEISQWGPIVFANQGATFGGTFRNCSNLNVTATDIPTLAGTAQVGFFEGCGSLVFNSSINNWDVGGKSVLSGFFLNCGSFNQPLNNWNVSNVNNFSNVLRGCSSFNQPLNSWNMASAVNMDLALLGCTVFNQPLDSWDLNGVTILRGLFSTASAFNQDISGWDVSAVSNFGTTGSGVFRNAFAFNGDIGAWNVSSGTSFLDFMLGKSAANYSASNLDSIYNGWTNRILVAARNINFGSIKYTAASSEGRALIVRPNATVTATNAVNNGSGLIRITTGAAHSLTTGNKIFISEILGTTEANGAWIVTVVNTTTIDLQASIFTNAYTSGGTVRTGYGWTLTDGGI